MSHTQTPPDTASDRPLDDGEASVSSVAAASAALATGLALSACGGGSDDPDGSAASGDSSSRAQATATASAPDSSTLGAFRLLTQATFGPVPSDVTALASKIRSLGSADAIAAWVDEQSSMPKSNKHFEQTIDNFENLIQYYYREDESGPSPKTWFLRTHHLASAWWKNALTAQDQLRLRVAFALSEILTVSMAGSLRNSPAVCAHYYDMLVDGAFGSYRDLIANVATHPAMGIYLSHLRNERPDPSIGRIPDQNFARELMQLFTLGLYLLKPDGSRQLDAAGKPQETYTPDDIRTLSHVFTGWSWAGGDFGRGVGINEFSFQNQWMQAYAQYAALKRQYPVNASTGKITLLGSPLNIQDDRNDPNLGNPVDNLQAALDIIFAHQNLAPFIARQMIQRLVTSNPSATYIRDVAAAFKSANFNLLALVKAILAHPEATNSASVRTNVTYGKLKEPILRVTQFFRAYKVQSVGGLYVINDDAEVDTPGLCQSMLGQGPLAAPSVFNFFRPGYLAPGSRMAKQNKVTPEMQLCDETNLARYAQVMQRATYDGYGCLVATNGKPQGTGKDLQNPIYSVYADFQEELTAFQNGRTATNRFGGINQVVDLINMKLFAGTMSTKLQAQLRKVASSTYATTTPLGADSFSAPADLPQFYRLALATMLFMATLSPEYVVQR